MIGRDPVRVQVAPMVRSRNRKTQAVIAAAMRPVDALVLISEVLNNDSGSKGYDEPFTDEEPAGLSRYGFKERVVKHLGKKNPTVRDFIEVSGRGAIAVHKVFCGTLQSVAVPLEAWFTAPARDGFVPAATDMPGACKDAARVRMPELQRRGLFQTEYRVATLRESLELPVPRRSDWPAERRAAQ